MSREHEGQSTIGIIVKPTLSGRTWGDGGGDEREHTVDAISFMLTPNYIYCSCGAEPIRADTPAELAAQWRSHGGKILGDKGFTERALDPETGPDELRRAAAVLALQEIWARCTCDTTDVFDCPNYMDGDEATMDLEFWKDGGE
jgi:hypothetical protein